MSDSLPRVNVIEGEPSDRQMTTGNHTVRDIQCCKCGTVLGWKYVRLHAKILNVPGNFYLTVYYRTELTNHLRNIRKANTFSSVTCSLTYSSDHGPVSLGLAPHVKSFTHIRCIRPRTEGHTGCIITYRPTYLRTSVYHLHHRMPYSKHGLL